MGIARALTNGNYAGTLPYETLTLKNDVYLQVNRSIFIQTHVAPTNLICSVIYRGEPSSVYKIHNLYNDYVSS